MEESKLHSADRPGCRVATRTDVGLRRKRNEDYLSVNETPHGLLVIVCDGMGGHQGGERASRLAVQAFVERLLAAQGDPHDVLREATAAANSAVFGESRSVQEYAGMGTTVVAALVRDGHAIVVNVGDSRSYLMSASRLRRVSIDHSVVEELVASGRLTRQQARTHPQRNLITRALGTSERVEPDLFDVDLGDGDELLLSSDGLHGMIDDEEIGAILGRGRPLEETCDDLVKAALDAGGDDNVTVALVRCGADAAASAGPLTEPNTLPPLASRGRRGSIWIWLTFLIVAAAAAWLMLVARPWVTADRLAPTPTPQLDVDTSLSGVDSIEVDSASQLTPFDALRQHADTIVDSSDTSFRRDSLGRGGGARSGASQQPGRRAATGRR